VLSTGDASFSFRASEDTTTFQCAIDGGAPTPCAPPASFSGLARGLHTFSVVATDAAHNQDPSPAQVRWLIAADADGDGYIDANPFGGAIDCNDHAATVNPGVREIPGNRTDENCDGTIAPFQRVTTTFSFGWRGINCHGCIHLRKLVALNVARGTTLRLSCQGHGCHFKRKLRSRSKDVARVKLLKLFRGRGLRPGTTITLRATSPGAIGVVKRLHVVKKRGGVLDVNDSSLCFYPGKPNKLHKVCQTIR
jgi:hypothetical protein